MWYVIEAPTLTESAKKRNAYKTWDEVKVVVKNRIAQPSAHNDVSIYLNDKLFATADPWFGCVLTDGSNRRVLPPAPQFYTQKRAVKLQRWDRLEEAKKAGYQVCDVIKYLNR